MSGASHGAVGGAASARCGRLTAPGAIAVAAVLVLLSGEASASALRDPSATIGALAVFAGLIFMREWPMALTGSIWAAGTVFVAAFWFFRTRLRAEWSALSVRSFVRPAGKAGSGRAGALPFDVCASTPTPEAEVLRGAARRCFVDLQAAWDLGDVAVLREHTTPEMFAELLQELPMRGPGPNRTDVLTLHATLIGFERLGSRCLASVEFSGMIREHAEQGAMPFKEVWMLTSVEGDNAAWRLARQQALL